MDETRERLQKNEKRLSAVRAAGLNSKWMDEDTMDEDTAHGSGVD